MRHLTVMVVQAELIAVHPGAVEIALEADHPTTGPPVEARSTANHAATTWERGESDQIDPGADSASSRVCRPRESFQAPLPLISLISDSYRVMRTAPLVAMPLCARPQRRLIEKTALIGNSTVLSIKWLMSPLIIDLSTRYISTGSLTDLRDICPVVLLIDLVGEN